MQIKINGFRSLRNGQSETITGFLSADGCTPPQPSHSPAWSEYFLHLQPSSALSVSSATFLHK